MIVQAMRERSPKLPRVFIRQDGATFRVIFEHQYPHAVEEMIYSERFKTAEEAQNFVHSALRAQRIYRNLAG